MAEHAARNTFLSTFIFHSIFFLPYVSDVLGVQQFMITAFFVLNLTKQPWTPYKIIITEI